ncbi:hypothetical protein A2U01_0054850, partial [Trifolium medium]|nr:hypothetical protein [Trifolium medium]
MIRSPKRKRAKPTLGLRRDIRPPSNGAGNRRTEPVSYAAGDLDRGGPGGCHPPSHHPKPCLH